MPLSQKTMNDAANAIIGLWVAAFIALSLGAAIHYGIGIGLIAFGAMALISSVVLAAISRRAT